MQAGSHRRMTIVKQVEQNSPSSSARGKEATIALGRRGGLHGEGCMASDQPRNLAPGEESGPGCTHLNSSGIPESVHVQKAQEHTGPGFQQV